MRLAALLAIVVAAGCGDDDFHNHPVDAPADGDGVMRTEVASLPATNNRDLDVLFVIDDSPSTLDKQTNLQQSFPVLVSSLSALPGGLPNLHVGVVTSDLGTSAANGTVGPSIGSGPGACIGTGKAGNLQTFGSISVIGNFITDIQNTDGSRSTNYTGTLSSAFSSIAAAGTNGCGFEQSIEAAQRALADNPANAGFLRPSANLAVVFLTDEDDCSLATPTLVGTDTTTYGPLQSFRCTRFGITCDSGGATSAEMDVVGTKDQCHSNEAGSLTNLADHVTFLQGLKADPRQVMIGALAGPATPFAVELRDPPGGGTPLSALAHSCAYLDAANQTEVADPAVRVAELASHFEHHVVQSVCSDLSTGVAALAAEMGTLVGSPCLTAPIVLPPDCTVTNQAATGPAEEIPPCPNPLGACFSIVADAAACPDLQNLELVVDRVNPPDPTTVTTARCVVP